MSHEAPPVTSLTIHATENNELAFPLPLGLAGNVRAVDEISVRSTTSSKLKKRVKRSEIHRDVRSLPGPARRSTRARKPVKKINM